MAEVHQTMGFWMLHANLKGHMAPLLKSIYYELRTINLYLEGAAFNVNTI